MVIHERPPRKVHSLRTCYGIPHFGRVLYATRRVTTT